VNLGLTVRREGKQKRREERRDRNEWKFAAEHCAVDRNTARKEESQELEPLCDCARGKK
jgi:hypothetical protein